MELEQDSLFGEETVEQIYEMLKDVEEYGTPSVIKDIFNIRESVLIAAVNKINTYLEETEFDFSSETWMELKALYLYGQGYHNQTKEEMERRQRAYKLFRFQLAKQGKLVENIDLCRDAVF